MSVVMYIGIVCSVLVLMIIFTDTAGVQVGWIVSIIIFTI